VSDSIDELKYKGWRCEQDCTARGGEYITPILPFDDIDETIKIFTDDMIVRDLV
jgi:hypothetical protein